MRGGLAVRMQGAVGEAAWDAHGTVIASCGPGVEGPFPGSWCPAPGEASLLLCEFVGVVGRACPLPRPADSPRVRADPWSASPLRC